jgi:hypothetical protein
MKLRPSLQAALLLAPLAFLLTAGAGHAQGTSAPIPQAGQATPATAPAGRIKRTAGTVTLERTGSRAPVAVGTTVQPGDILRTGADGAVGLTLADDTLLTLGADSELVLDAFTFDTTTHDGGLLLSLWRGTVAVVTGLIGRKAPEQLRVRTRTVVLGVRGTEFIVDASGTAR